MRSRQRRDGLSRRAVHVRAASSRSQHIDRLPRALRLLITAGARIDPETVALVSTSTSHRKVHSFYGSSETGGIAYDDSEELQRSAPRRPRRCPRRGHDPSSRVGGRGPHLRRGQGRRVRLRADAGDDARSRRSCDGGFLTGDLGYLDDGRPPRPDRPRRRRSSTSPDARSTRPKSSARCSTCRASPTPACSACRATARPAGRRVHRPRRTRR